MAALALGGAAAAPCDCPPPEEVPAEAPAAARAAAAPAAAADGLSAGVLAAARPSASPVYAGTIGLGLDTLIEHAGAVT